MFPGFIIVVVFVYGSPESEIDCEQTQGRALHLRPSLLPVIVMALTATPYKVDLSLSDLDREVYENLRFTVARHPSETEERLAARLLAHALWYGESLTFGRGLSDVDEPALWEKSLDNRTLHWIEVGQPDAERLIWCSRRAERVSLLVYGNRRVWEGRVVPSVTALGNLNIAALSQEPLIALADDLPRAIKWSVMISEDTLFVTDERGQHELQVEWLQGER